MITKEEIERWLRTLPAGTKVYVDDGGLSLETRDGAYLEVGGAPEEWDIPYGIMDTSNQVVPDEVKTVHDVAARNLESSGDEPDRLYTYYDFQSNEWRICDNFERSSFALIYSAGKWYIRRTSDGRDREASLEAAIGNAQSWFTG